MIKSYVQPARLYRYRSLKNAEEVNRELGAITGGYVHCSLYLDLNDPMEGSFSSSKLLRKSGKYQQFRNTISDTKETIGMCSFSEVYNHELMWAHYADHFKGMCVGYSLNRLLRYLEPDVEFVRMFYSEKVPTVGSGTKDATLLAKKVLSYKNYRWLYEREWRMFGRRGKAHYGSPSCVTHVYLGSRMTPGNRERIISTLRPLGIKLSEMSINKYTISFTPRSTGPSAKGAATLFAN